MPTKQELHSENYELCKQGLELMRTIKTAFLELGRVLMEIRDTQAYYPHWENFSSYLDEEKNMSEANASKLITVYHRFIMKMKEPYHRIAALDWSVLYDMHRLYGNDDELREAFDDAALLTTSHLRQKLHERKTGISQESCQHTHNYTIRVCTDCGQRVKVFE